MWNPYLFSLLIPEDYKEVNVQLVEQDLHLIPCLDATERAALVSEIPVYAAISRVFRSDTDDCPSGAITALNFQIGAKL